MLSSNFCLLARYTSNKFAISLDGGIVALQVGHFLLISSTTPKRDRQPSMQPSQNEWPQGRFSGSSESSRHIPHVRSVATRASSFKASAMLCRRLNCRGCRALQARPSLGPGSCSACSQTRSTPGRQDSPTTDRQMPLLCFQCPLSEFPPLQTSVVLLTFATDTPRA